ncbi:MAG: hypothetical protein EHM93_09975 [Bacteroidales bacterium]|nr:MAG: hypothetical protein EHM93_09975 [Bacteroidales bacterium]
MDKKISERKVLIFTSALIVFTGLVRILNYPVGFVLFYIAFLPYIFYRLSYYYKLRGKAKVQIDKYRLIILVTIIISILLNLIGVQDVEFFLLFLLMIDFLLVINKNG